VSLFERDMIDRLEYIALFFIPTYFHVVLAVFK